jgi:hypothetical protein
MDEFGWSRTESQNLAVTIVFVDNGKDPSLYTHEWVYTAKCYKEYLDSTQANKLKCLKEGTSNTKENTTYYNPSSSTASMIDHVLQSPSSLHCRPLCHRIARHNTAVLAKGSSELEETTDVVPHRSTRNLKSKKNTVGMPTLAGPSTLL